MKTYETNPEDPDRERRMVGVSEYEVVADGSTLVAYGLGACVGLAVYDPENAVGGLAHAMLPRRSEGDGTGDGKYVDAAVETMLREAVSAGASYGALEGYVVGGSDLLDLRELPREVSDDNVATARETFADLDVSVEGEDVGGGRGRTVEFDTETGRVAVLTAYDPEPVLLRVGDDGDADAGES
ncbi:chemotaxis protein CheD [Halorussus gelatinilyticus]|uniref:Probable chemoreceptor glutamine deamidase CheD n=1 Tax=Halorussus gelatinilyticus TaxID=2937524 RepID=A0A8U0IGX2_9EURY|nr:chemotaxis protein CheD [Halorussus gelatinilyticus]UPV99481.1 chemotaxis protein CheD [Halorussus gelatinilyticus]